MHTTMATRASLVGGSLLLLLLLLLQLVVLCPVLGAPQCKNPNGKDVDWYIVYNLPLTSNVESSFNTKGDELAYVDSSMKNAKGFKLLNSTVNDVKGNPFALTLADLFKGKKINDSLYVVYNDQPPEPYNGTAKGHTKGVVQFSEDGGYWLMHSVPRFPFNVGSKKFEFPESGRNNGQVFMCMSFKGDQLPRIAAALRQQYPYIYESGAPKRMLNNTEIKLLMERKFVRRPEGPVLIETLVGVSGTKFQSFAKHQSADDEIFSNIIAPKLGVGMLVATWQNGAGGKLGPTCPVNGVAVSNMANVVINFSDKRKIVFRSTENHAKWSVSTDPSKPWFCNSSLNRMLSQFRRGGQTTCIQDPVLHGLFTSAVEKCEMCDRPGVEMGYCKKRVNG